MSPGGWIPIGIAMIHGPEFVNLNKLIVEAIARLAKQNRTGAVESHHQRHAGENRRENQQQDCRGDMVKYVFQMRESIKKRAPRPDVINSVATDAAASRRR